MAPLKNFLEQALTIWKGLSASARVVAVVGVVSIALCAVAVGIWSARPQFIPLCAGLSPAETAEIVSRLDSKGIPHKLNFSGSTVLVSKSKWNEARMVAGDVTEISSTESWDEGMLGDPSLSRFRMYRRREETLSRTIGKMAGIAHATVHIAVSERSPFVSEQQPVTASVVVEVARGATILREQADAIVALVAGSVEGLSRDSVSVMDARGRMLSSANGYGGGDVDSQFEFRRRLESDLAAKASVLLAQLLGEGRGMVRVSADIDFTSLERTETIFDPNLKVRTQEEVRSFQKTTADRFLGGAVEGEANLGKSSSAFAQGAPSKEVEESNTTTYENAKTVDVLKQAPGKIQRLTVAVMADLSEVAAAAATSPQAAAGNANPASPPVSQEQIAAIVKQAVGFDESRGDQIEVLITRFAPVSAADDPLVATKKWDFVNSILRNASLGVASIVALILGLMTLKKIRPVTIQMEGAGSGDDGRDELLASLSERIQQNPKAMQTILSVWLNESDRSDAGPEVRSKAA